MGKHLGPILEHLRMSWEHTIGVWVEHLGGALVEHKIVVVAEHSIGVLAEHSMEGWEELQ